MPKDKESGFEKYKNMLSDSDPRHTDEYFKKDCESFDSKVTEDEKEAVMRYTGSSYTAMNQYLRDGKMGSGENPELEKRILECEKGLNKFKLRENLLLSRKSGDDIFSDLGIHLSYFMSHDDIAQFVQEVNNSKGARVHDKGFTSTSTCNKVWDGRVWFEIQAPKGTSCAYVNHISYHPSEQEVILNRGTEYEIVGARMQKTPDGLRPIVTMKVVGRKK